MAYLVPSLVRFWKEVNTRWPHRDHWSDGWLGDTSHSARFSDHNPDSAGRVHAVDTDATVAHAMGSGPIGDEIVRCLLTLARSGRPNPINYIIYKGTIYSRAYGFRARKYYGSNQHDSHVHLSVMRTDYGRNFKGSWGIAIPTIDASRVMYAFSNHPTASPVNVAKFQSRLRDRGYLKRPYIIGRAGKKTKAALKAWQKQNGYKVDGIPGRVQITKIVAPSYRVVD